MKHLFVDKYSYLNTSLHRISSVIKIIVFFIIDITVLIVSELTFLIYPIMTVFLLVTIYLSKIPIGFILRKIFVIIPFVLFIFLCKFFSKSLSYVVIIKTFLNSLIIIVALVLLVETTKFVDLLKALSKMGIPKIIVILLSFIYRYFFVFIDEVGKMVCAVKIRSCKNMNVKTYANIVGTLFIRSYERAEKIYSAMVIRGFNGEMK